MTTREQYPSAQELIRLNGKVAIVTGGATGIGFAVSYRLAEAGTFVFIADIDPKKADEASQQLNSQGYQTSPVECDVSREESVRNMLRTATEKGRPDILVNNAGIYPRIPLVETSTADYDRVMSVNLKGAFLCSREVAREMIAQRKSGCIVNIASIEAIHPSSTGLSAYSASKAGLLMLTKSTALELAGHNIRVNAIAPGGIVTEGLRSYLSETPAQGKARLKEFMSRIPLGRMGRADDVARVVLFLASDLASYMTGSLTVVDGGFLIG